MSWTFETQSLSARLAGERQVRLRALKLESSTADFLEGAPQVVWDVVVRKNGQATTEAWGGRPNLMIPPVSRRQEMPILPKWRVQAWLQSQSMRPDGDGSELVLTFFCNDIASRPITDAISEHFDDLDETTWCQFAKDFWD